MVATPRSAKRRRLDTLPLVAPSPTRGSSAKYSNKDDPDIYDDIDGALQPSTPLKRRTNTRQRGAARSPVKRAVRGTPSKQDVRQQDGQRPRHNGLGQPNARLTRGSTAQRTVNGDYEQSVEMDVDELAISAMSPDTSNSAHLLETETRIGQLSGSKSDRKTSRSMRTNVQATQKRGSKNMASSPAASTVDRSQRTAQLDMVDMTVLKAMVGDDNDIDEMASCRPQTSLKSSPTLATCKSIVLSKLSQRHPIPLTNLSNEYNKVHQLLEATITAGESNSLLLIGARGSGKTALVNAALLDLSRSQKEHFHTVRLNGFIQTDDKLALREIWRQLGSELSETDEDGTEDAPKSYADTLAMLLALLSHPDEISDRRSEAATAAKSVIFIMDEFDLFGTHARQTLLYNLLDIAQSRKAPIAVLGLTTRTDVMEGLEKRVKSRFSHRFVHFSVARTFSEFVDTVKMALMITKDELAFEERNMGLKDGSGHRLQEWNDAVEALFNSSSFLKQYIQRIYYTTKSVPGVLASLLLPTSTLQSLPHPAHYITPEVCNCLRPPDSNLHILASLSELCLSLLIAAARLSIIHNTDHTNFPLAYAEYISLSSKARLSSSATGAIATGAGTRIYSKEVAKREWERLIGYGLLVPVQAGAFGLGSLSRVAGEMVRVDVMLEEIPLCVEGMGTVMEKWCRQI